VLVVAAAPDEAVGVGVGDLGSGGRPFSGFGGGGTDPDGGFADLPGCGAVGVDQVFDDVFRPVVLLDAGELPLEIVRVHGERRSGLFLAVDAGGVLRRLPRLVQGRQQHRGEDGDDRNYDQKFDQSKRGDSRLHFMRSFRDWCFYG